MTDSHLQRRLIDTVLNRRPTESMTDRLRPFLVRLRLLVLSHPLVHRLLAALAKGIVAGGRRGPDVAFVMPPANAPGWILDAICREISQRLSGTTTLLVRSAEPLPPATSYFFSHYMYFVRALSPLSPVRGARSYVFATHIEPDKHRIDDALLARVLSFSDGVICMNEALRRHMVNCGVPAHKVHTVIGAADNTVFRPHVRVPDGLVGFCSAFYPRKSPDLLLGIVRGLPHRRFVLLGKRWREYARYEELIAMPNFRYMEIDYDDYAAWYARMSVFVSVSQLEGGPIPLIEAMMSNVVPVASRTGFAPDLIREGENGFLFDVDASVDDVCALVERAFELQDDVAESTSQYDWVPFSARISELMQLRASGDSTQTPSLGPLPTCRNND